MLMVSHVCINSQNESIRIARIFLNLEPEQG